MEAILSLVAAPRVLTAIHASGPAKSDRLGDRGPRASQALMLAVRARALLGGPLRAVHRRLSWRWPAPCCAQSHGPEFLRPPRRRRDHGPA